MQLVELTQAEMETVIGGGLFGGSKNVIAINLEVDLSRCIKLGSLVIVRNNGNTEGLVG